MIAEAFNRAVSSGELQAPVVISRDHHDVSGTDSPYRETSNITDGSMFCADMAVQVRISLRSFKSLSFSPGYLLPVLSSPSLCVLSHTFCLLIYFLSFPELCRRFFPRRRV